MFLSSVISLSFALPVAEPIPSDDENEPRITSNDLFHQLNELLFQKIQKEIKNDSIEVGDKIDDKDGSFHITVQHFSSFNSFPVAFQPKDDEVLDDKKIVPIVNEFDGSSEYEINKEEDKAEKNKTKTIETSSKKLETANEIGAKEDKLVKSFTSQPLNVKKLENSTTAPPATTSTKTTDSSSLTSVSPVEKSSSLPSENVKNQKLLKEIAEEPIFFTHI